MVTVIKAVVLVVTGQLFGLLWVVIRDYYSTQPWVCDPFGSRPNRTIATDAAKLATRVVHNFVHISTWHLIDGFDTKPTL